MLRSKSRYVYVTCFGGVWRFGRRKYQQWLIARVEDEDVSLDDYGQYLGPVEVDITDMTQDELRGYLE